MRTPYRYRACLVASLTVVTVGLGACSSGDSGSSSTPTEWTETGAPNGSDRQQEAQAPDPYKSVPPVQALSLSLSGPRSAMVAPDSWPEITSIVSTEQISGALPGRGVDRADKCGFGPVGGSMTPKFVSCTWELRKTTDADDKDVVGSMQVAMKAVGADSEVIKTFDSHREELRKDSPDGFVSYRDGAYGARRSMFTPANGRQERGKTEFVVSDGQVAIWFTAAVTEDASEQFLKTSGESADDVLRTKVYPTLTRSLVPLLPRKH